MENYNKELLDVIRAFGISGELVEIKVNKQGHINSTFISLFNDNGKICKYTHQKINKSVFHHPDQVMDNIVRVTDYISSRITGDDKDRLVLNVIRALDGKPYHIDSEGEYWRCYNYIDNAVAYDKCTSPELANRLGSAIGNFQLELADFDGASLYPTIENFHNMIMRYDNLIKAIDADRVGRRATVQEEIDFLLSNRSRGEEIWRAYESGELPSRVTHNDTKINNVLFDSEKGEPLAVIDLDTIMPGTILFDTGDMIRTSCNTSDEDEKNLSLVEFDSKLYASLIQGYMDRARSFLSEKELSGILASGRMMMQIMAVRFLTDYLDGDNYYHIAYPEHNLVRARSQIKLMKSMDDSWNDLEAITSNIISKDV